MAIVTDKSQIVQKILAHGFLSVFLLVVLFPFFVIVMISLQPGNMQTAGTPIDPSAPLVSVNLLTFQGKTELQKDGTYAYDSRLGQFVDAIIPDKISVEHWRNALCYDKNEGGWCPSYTDDQGKEVTPPFPVLKWLWNSVYVSAVSAVLILLFSTTSAYAFARMKFKHQETILKGLMLTQMFPSVLALVAIFALFTAISDIPVIGKYIGYNTHAGLILAYVAGISMHVWTIRGYYTTIPVEIEEAAKVDGATPFQAFRYVLLPMALPVLMVVGLFAFIGGILEYPVAVTLLNDYDTLTFAVGAKSYFSAQDIKWGDFAAAAILSGLPITILFMLAQKWMVSGLTSGGVKG